MYHGRALGCEIVIATPGRLNDFLSTGDTNMKRCSYLVSRYLFFRTHAVLNISVSLLFTHVINLYTPGTGRG